MSLPLWPLFRLASIVADAAVAPTETPPITVNPGAAAATEAGAGCNEACGWTAGKIRFGRSGEFCASGKEDDEAEGAAAEDDDEEDDDDAEAEDTEFEVETGAPAAVAKVVISPPVFWLRLPR